MKKKRIIDSLIYFVLFSLGIIYIAPFAISVLISIKNREETANSLLAIPKSLHWENYTEAIERAKMVQSYFNSIFLTIVAVSIVILFSSMAAYAIARQYHRKVYRAYEVLLLASMMIPFQTLMIPIYKMLKNLQLMNTLPGAILIISGLNMAFAILMYIGFIKTLPYELEEAAIVEGCGRIKLFYIIVLPLLKPITFTIGVLDALWIWNEFTISLLILQSDDVKTLPIQQYVFFGEHSSNYNMAFAAAILAMIPIMIFFLLAQKHIVKGLTNGAVKG